MDGLKPPIFRGVRCPPAGMDWPNAPARSFHENDWDLDKFLIAVLGEFVQLKVAGKAWHELLDPAQDGYAEAETPLELAELRALIERVFARPRPSTPCSSRPSRSRGMGRIRAAMPATRCWWRWCGSWFCRPKSSPPIPNSARSG